MNKFIVIGYMIFLLTFCLGVIGYALNCERQEVKIEQKVKLTNDQAIAIAQKAVEQKANEITEILEPAVFSNASVICVGNYNYWVSGKVMFLVKYEGYRTLEYECSVGADGINNMKIGEEYVD